MQGIRHFSKRCFSFCWTSLAILVILLALVVSFSRMLIPLAADYKVELEQVASEQLGRSVSIGSIKAEWVGFWPSIHLNTVSIQSNDAREGWLQASDVWLSLDFLSLITSGSFDAGRVKINGLNLDVVRNNEKEYLLNGEVFRLDQNNRNDQANLIDWLFSRDRLQLVDSRISYQDARYSDNRLDLAEVNFYLENKEAEHHTYGRFSIAGDQPSQLSFVLDMKGDVQRPLELDSQFYIQGDVFVSSVMREWMKPYIDLKRGAFNLKLWGAGYLHNLKDLTAELQARDLQWSLPNENLKEAESKLKELKANVFWQRQKNGWNLDIEKFQLNKDGTPWPESEIHMTYQDADSVNQSTFEGTINFLKLEDVSGLLSDNLPAGISLAKEIRALDMRGSLRDIQFRLQQDEQQIPEVYFSSTFEDLGFNRWDQLPGVTGLDGRLIFSREKGFLQLDSQQVVLDFGDFFKQPIPINALQGDVFWRSGDAGVELSFDRLIAISEYIQTETRGNVLFSEGSQSPFIDMVVGFSNGQVKPASRYLPQGVLSKEVAEWLETSFASGRVSTGTMIFHGRAEDFPFSDNSGTFLADLELNDVHLVYGDLWPQLTKVNADIVFSDNSLQVEVQEGESMGVKLLPSKLNIDDLRGYSVLDLELAFSGETQQLLSYLSNSPVSDDARDLLAGIKTNGTMSSKLKIAIPMSRFEKFTMQGKTHFHEGNVVMKKWDHEFKKFKGDLNYSYNGRVFSYHSDNLQAQYLGEPANINVSTDISDEDNVATTISLQSRLGLSLLFKDYLPDNQSLFKGNSDWTLALSLHKNNKHLLLKSDLFGEEITLPDNFSKSSQQPRQLSIRSNLNAGKDVVINLVYGDILNTVLQLRPQDEKASPWLFEKGTVYLGQTKQITLPAEKGLDISGKMDRLSIDKWLDLLPEQKYESAESNPLKMLNQVKLDVDQLFLGQQQYNDFSVLATRRQSDIMFAIGAKEFSGQVIVPFKYKDGSPVRVNLRHLSLTTPSEKLESTIPDPRKLPAIDFVCKKLLFNGRQLGQFNLQARKVKQGLQIDKLIIRGDLLNISASGSWLFKNSWHVSSFDMKFEADKIGEALKLFDFKTNIEGGKTSARMKASWSGPPHWFEMKRLNGDMRLSISKGQLYDLEPGGGRLFGLLSIQNLQRRLTLDFSDIFLKGFGFDKIEGSFSIADGDAYTNDLFMDGPAARVDISGRIGLSNEDYDEDVYVTPKLSSSLPVLGLAAGPHVAIGLFLTEKFLRNNINKISRIHYRVTGSWEKPLIEQSDDNTDSDEDEDDP